MSDLLVAIKPSERAREILDWTVFSLGVVSLTVAIAATVVSQIGGYDAANAVEPAVTGQDAGTL